MRGAAGLVVLALLLAALILNPAWFDWLFAPLTRNGAPAMYTHTSLLRLTLSHLAPNAFAYQHLFELGRAAK